MKKCLVKEEGLREFFGTVSTATSKLENLLSGGDEKAEVVPNPGEFASRPEDPWIHRSQGMRCRTCMFFCNQRCRRHAPTMMGYPAVFANDWCGDHKLDKASMGGAEG